MSESPDVRPTILVIDDEEGIRTVMELNLKRNGFNVITAVNGLHAIQKVKAGAQVDLIVCDLKMPGMGGVEVLKKMRGDLGLKVPFLILTGYAEKQLLMEAVKKGVNFVMVKPIKASELVAKVREYVHPPKESETDEEAS